jgi:hypothetical protein
MDTLSLHDARLLGLDDSWRVESVDLQIEDRRVEIRRSHVGSEVFCPECGGACGLAYHADERRRRHLDKRQFMTSLVAEGNGDRSDFEAFDPHIAWKSMKK